MVTGVIQSLLPALLLTASLTSSSPSSSAIARSELASRPLASASAYLRPNVFYVVKTGDTLASIAKSEYGDTHYWTTLWNDNSWIEDPNVIEDDWKIKISPVAPDSVDVLKPELAAKIESPDVIPSDTPSPFSVQNESESIVKPMPTVMPIVQTPQNGPLNEIQVNFLGSCESGMTASRNSGNGYYGAFQFSPGTWNSMGTGYTRADMAPLEVQKDAVQRLVSRSSIFTQFPGCSAQMRAKGIL